MFHTNANKDEKRSWWRRLLSWSCQESLNYDKKNWISVEMNEIEAFLLRATTTSWIVDIPRKFPFTESTDFDENLPIKLLTRGNKNKYRKKWKMISAIYFFYRFHLFPSNPPSIQGAINGTLKTNKKQIDSFCVILSPPH